MNFLKILFRSHRKDYVRKQSNDPAQAAGACVFCEATKAKTGLESLCVYQSTHSQILLNKYPYNSGHLLVMPRRHCGQLLQLSSEEYLDLSLTLKKAAEAVEKVYQPPGYNMGLNHGAAAGAGIPDHLHWHLVPRWSGDLNFFPLIAGTKVVIEDTQQTFERYYEHFSKA